MIDVACRIRTLEYPGNVAVLAKSFLPISQRAIDWFEANVSEYREGLPVEYELGSISRLATICLEDAGLAIVDTSEITPLEKSIFELELLLDSFTEETDAPVDRRSGLAAERLSARADAPVHLSGAEPS